MAKRIPETRIRSYGIYSKWETKTKELPRFVSATTKISAEINIEFGLIVNIRGGKNMVLNYCIDHPGIVDAEGNRRPPFDGFVFIKQNDWNFYLGDTIWEPIDDKLGDWRMTLELGGKIVADKTFHVHKKSEV